MKKQIIKLLRSASRIGVAAAVIAAAGLAMTASAGNSPAPGQSSAFGKTLAEWNDLYTRWAFGDVSVPTDGNGNAVVGNVVLWPTPLLLTQGSGHSDVTINSGQAFFMPLYGWWGTSYLDGTPNDNYLALSDFANNPLTVTIDGVTVINNQNKMNYFTEFPFNPAVSLPQPDFYPFNAIIYEQVISFVHTPLKPGTHQISVDATVSFPDSNPVFGPADWHYTWTVTVLR